MENKYFIQFKGSTDNISLPKKFTFPFYYAPHPISTLAVKELQEYLFTQDDFFHDFGLSQNTESGIGKMFGVLVVKNQKNELGYLAAFSGKLGNSNSHKYFVPPVYDILQDGGILKTVEKEIEKINQELNSIESNKDYLYIKNELKQRKKEAKIDLSKAKNLFKIRKEIRRKELQKNELVLCSVDYSKLKVKLNQEGLNAKFYLDELIIHWNYKLDNLLKLIEPYNTKIDELKKLRKSKSAEAQQQIFQDYTFLNSNKVEKSLLSIFDSYTPPSGAGECAAPKLLQFAYQTNLTPIALAEFWWGVSPKSEIRKHKQFYPSCIGKCKPILTHMLEGLNVDDNPLIIELATDKKIEYIYEDDDIIIINKPNELLSVPGKKVKDSVYQRIIEKHPHLTGPVIVHRLDMSTSGVMILSKNKEAYSNLQKQFITRKVKKRYIALLDGTIEFSKGNINLPLRVDLLDRPKQLVCYEHGKTALTYWELIDTKNNVSKVYLYPITGRTHQLRVHCAHAKGLNTPILGDDLYGTKNNRLHLHAEKITFTHPTKNKEVTFYAKAEF